MKKKLFLTILSSLLVFGGGLAAIENVSKDTNIVYASEPNTKAANILYNHVNFAGDYYAFNLQLTRNITYSGARDAIDWGDSIKYNGSSIASSGCLVWLASTSATSPYPYLQFIYPHSLASEGAVFKVEKGTSIGDAILDEMIITFHSGAWETETNNEATVSFVGVTKNNESWQPVFNGWYATYLKFSSILNAGGTQEGISILGKNITVNGKQIPSGYFIWLTEDPGLDTLQILYTSKDWLNPTDDYPITTLHINGGATFGSQFLPEVNLYLIDDKWQTEMPHDTEIKFTGILEEQNNDPWLAPGGGGFKACYLMFDTELCSSDIHVTDIFSQYIKINGIDYNALYGSIMVQYWIYDKIEYGAKRNMLMITINATVYQNLFENGTPIMTIDSFNWNKLIFPELMFYLVDDNWIDASLDEIAPVIHKEDKVYEFNAGKEFYSDIYAYDEFEKNILPVSYVFPDEAYDSFGKLIEGDYVATVIAKDHMGNESQTTINVHVGPKDIEAPIIHTNVREINAQVGDYFVSDIIATDNIDDVEVVYSWSSNPFDENGRFVLGEYVLTISAIDKTGNITTIEINVHVSETRSLPSIEEDTISTPNGNDATQEPNGNRNEFPIYVFVISALVLASITIIITLKVRKHAKN